MKIIVCVKQIIDPEHRLRLDPQTDRIDETGISYVINPRDLFALEQALQLRDATGEAGVIVLSVGPARIQDSLIECLAMGADQAIALWEDAFEGSDNHVVAGILSRAIERVGFDMILCGRVSADDNAQHVPATIAQMLNIPLVSSMTRVDVDGDQKRVIAHRALPKGDREVVECTLPALLSVEADINRPRYPRLRLRLQAHKEGVITWNGHDVGMDSREVGLAGSMLEVQSVSYPKPRTKKVEKPDANLPPHLRLQWLMQGGAAKKQDSDDGPFEGTPEDAASKVLNLLVDEKFLPVPDRTDARERGAL